MRYLIDTNIIVFLLGGDDMLSKDVRAIIAEPETVLCASVESIKELIVAYRSKRLFAKKWKTPQNMLDSIEEEYYITILPLRKEHVRTYSNLTLNMVQDHKDPSDHTIIAHAITEHLPLISSDSRFDFYRSQGLDLIYNRK